MSNEQKLREIAYKHAEPKVIWNDGNMSIYPDEEKIESLLSDLTALISEHYYPKEFVEWTMMQGIVGIYDRKGYLYSSALLNLKGFKGDNTIKNLFNYWKENER